MRTLDVILDQVTLKISHTHTHTGHLSVQLIFMKAYLSSHILPDIHNTFSYSVYFAQVLPKQTATPPTTQKKPQIETICYTMITTDVAIAETT